VKRRKISGRGGAVGQTVRPVSERRSVEFWRGMEAYNQLAAPERAAYLGQLGITASDALPKAKFATTSCASAAPEGA
jgi:hypothetical protein